MLGCLLEKQRTTPDQYPLSLNALRLACNQSTNRDPVVEYDESTIRDALHRLERRGSCAWPAAPAAARRSTATCSPKRCRWARASRRSDCVLMLRGAQTPGELKQRSERMHAFAELDAVHETLERLIERELVVRLDRRPGQKEERYAQLLRGRRAEAAARERAEPAAGRCRRAGRRTAAGREAARRPRVAAQLDGCANASSASSAKWPSCARRCAMLLRARRAAAREMMTHAALILASSADTATGVGIPLALAAGLVSFLSPCVLPLVPGYLSTVIGVTPADLKEGVGARRVLVPSLMFIASFSLIFILLGLSATVIGSSLNEHKDCSRRSAAS